MVKSKPKLLLAVEESLYPGIFSESDGRRLRDLAAVINAAPPARADRAFLLGGVAEAEIVVTSWRTAALDAEIMARAGQLKLLCHGAGTVRPVVSDPLWDRGVTVTSAAEAIAHGVAEFCLALILTASKRVYWHAAATRGGQWREAGALFGGSFEIYRQKIGVIGAGHVGRLLIGLLKNFTCEILVYDPYLSPEAAEKLGVRPVATLEELFGSCRAVSLNAPTNEGTRHMLRGPHFAAFQPGSVFVNTAGGTHIHEEEFIAELSRGRFIACIDRCVVEPCALDHPFRQLPNVLLTPHIAGAVADNRLRIGSLVVAEVERYVQRLPPLHAVTREALARMA